MVNYQYFKNIIALCLSVIVLLITPFIPYGTITKLKCILIAVTSIIIYATIFRYLITQCHI